jgi:hypothetical protein
MLGKKEKDKSYLCNRPWRPIARKPERKRPLGRPRRKWMDNIKIDLREIWT